MRNFPCDRSRNLVLNVTHLKKKKKNSTPNHRNISNYTNNMLETATYLTGGISLPKVFPTLQSRGHYLTKAQKSYVATKNNREKKSK